VGLSLREIREVLQSPSDGPYGLTANLCEEAFKRLSVQRAEAETGLFLLMRVVGAVLPSNALDRLDGTLSARLLAR